LGFAKSQLSVCKFHIKIWQQSIGISEYAYAKFFEALKSTKRGGNIWPMSFQFLSAP